MRVFYCAICAAAIALTAVWPALSAQGQPADPTATEPGAKPAKARTPPAESVANSPEAATKDHPNQSVIDPAVNALLAVAKEKDNPLCYVFPPVSQRKFLGYQQVPQRYHQEMVMAPTYRYETVTVTEPVTQGTQTFMTTRQVRRPVAQTGVQAQPRLIPDPNGPIVRMVSIPQWGPGGAEYGSQGWLGNNALALVALLRCGVSPEREPAVKKLAERLSQYVLAFGIPDSTWDLAWTMVAFDEYPGGVYRGQLDWLSARLIAGQIAEGPGKGLWGPVCVNPTMLRYAVNKVLSNPLPLAAGRAPMALNPAMAAMQRQVQAAQERAFIEFTAVSLLGSAFKKATRSATLPDTRNQFGNDVEVAGWPVNLYRETTADLESTALAAYALRVATSHMKLPATLEYPHSVSFCADFSTRDALVAAISAVAAAQHDNGAWDEMVVWQPVEQFRDGGEGQFGPAVEPQELSSLSTPIATAEGCNALEDLLTVLDRIDTSKRPATKASKKVVKPVQVSGRRPKPPTLADPAAYRAQIVKGRRRLLEQIAEVSSGPARAGANVDSSSDTRNPKPRGHATQNGPLPVDPLWGGPLEPYALLVQLRLEGENAARSDADHAKRAALEELVASAIQSQEPSGLWPVTEDFMPWTPSVRERGLCMVAPPAKRKAGQRPPAARTKTMPGRGGRGWPAAVSAVTVQQSRTASALQAIRDQIYNDTRFWSVDNEETQRLATAYMLCYLAGTSGSADAPPAASTSSEKKPEAVEEPTPKEDPSPAADPGTH